MPEAPSDQQSLPAAGDAGPTARMSRADLQDYIARQQAAESPGASPPGQQPTGYGEQQQAYPPPAYGQQAYGEPPAYGQQPGYGEQAGYPGPYAGAAVVAPPDVYGAQSTYPVSVTWEIPPSNSRFFAIPLIGYIVKLVILIPHIIALYALALVVGVCQLFLWIPVLFGGKYSDFGYNLVGGTIRWGTRVAAYFYGLTDQYPPFSLGAAGDQYPVQVAYERPPSNNRFFAVPLLGILVKEIILIPHFIVLYVLSLIVGILQYVLWIPVLFGGKYPDFGYQFVGGTLRWGARVFSYLLGLTDKYPPFQLSN
jgi:hypothetical protein